MPENIPTEELERLVRDARAKVSTVAGHEKDHNFAGSSFECPLCIKRREADADLRKLAPTLAAEVLAGRKALTQAREALEELTFVFEDVRQYPLRISQKVTERLAAVGRDALAAMPAERSE